MVIILVDIGGYSINGYWWLNYHRLLVVILLVIIVDYFIVSHCWLFYW
jgi:hypothetical protein